MPSGQIVVDDQNCFRCLGDQREGLTFADAEVAAGRRLHSPPWGRRNSNYIRFASLTLPGFCHDAIEACGRPDERQCTEATRRRCGRSVALYCCVLSAGGSHCLDCRK